MGCALGDRHIPSTRVLGTHAHLTHAPTPREGRTRPNVMGACGMPSNGGETIQLYGRGFVRSRGPVAHFGLNQGSTRRFATLCTLFAPRDLPNPARISTSLLPPPTPPHYRLSLSMFSTLPQINSSSNVLRSTGDWKTTHGIKRGSERPTRPYTATRHIVSHKRTALCQGEKGGF